MISYNKRLTPSKTQHKIVVQGKKGMATYPKKVVIPPSQEKLWEEYWK